MRLVTLALAAACVGCESWTGFGFRDEGGEMARLHEVLALDKGKVVADVGAGKGGLTFALAKVVSEGRVFSTEIDPARLRRLQEAVLAAKLANVTVVEAHSSETGLPANCCDAIVLRRVYHHLSDPAATNLDLLRALRPGGVLAIIDFPPMFSWLWPWRTGHGMAAGLVVEEVTAGGFTLVKVIEDWPGRGPLKSYCAIFRKPEAGP